MAASGAADRGRRLVNWGGGGGGGGASDVSLCPRGRFLPVAPAELAAPDGDAAPADAGGTTVLVMFWVASSAGACCGRLG